MFLDLIRHTTGPTDATPIFAVLPNTPDVELNYFINRDSVSAPREAEGLTSSFVYKSNDQIYKLKAEVVHGVPPPLISNVAVYTLSGTLVPKRFYTVHQNIIYFLDTVIFFGPLYAKYDSTIADNNLTLLDLQPIESSDPGVESVDPYIPIIHTLRLFTLGIPDPYKSWKLAYSKFCVTDGVDLYGAKPSPITLHYVPVERSGQLFHTPTPVSPDADSIKIHFYANNEYHSYEFTNFQVDSFHNYVYIPGLVVTAGSALLSSTTRIYMTYDSPVRIIPLELNPLLPSGHYTATMTYIEHPIEFFVSGVYTDSSESVVLPHVEGTDVTLPDYLRTSAILSASLSVRRVSPEVTTVYQKPYLATTNGEDIHFVDRMFFDGTEVDMSAVVVFRFPKRKYDELIEKCRSDNPELDVSKYLREVAYKYLPVGRYGVIEIYDEDTNEIYKRII